MTDELWQPEAGISVFKDGFEISDIEHFKTLVPSVAPRKVWNDGVSLERRVEMDIVKYFHPPVLLMMHLFSVVI